jgi:hypothetical protein
MKVVQRVSTSKDHSGNPRRLWVVYRLSVEGNSFVHDSIYDEGYGGKPVEVQAILSIPEVFVSPSEWTAIRKMTVPYYSAVRNNVH